MKHINKESCADKGNAITEDYLSACRTEDPLNHDVYYSVDYDGTFRSLPSKQDSFYKRMRRLLIENQNGYCCYCMRRITGEEQRNPKTNKMESDTTLEHVIPQSAQEEDLAYYNTEQLSTIGDNKHVIITSVFTHTPNPTYPPYPHTVAYRNLTASCLGRFPSKGLEGCCCNNARSSDKAFPIYYLTGADCLIEYTHEGGIHAVLGNEESEKVEQMICAAKLHNPSLSEIRQLWYLLRNNTMQEINECNNDTDKRHVILSSALSASGLDFERKKELTTKFMIQNQWDTFIMYDYFHQIFT